MKPPMLFANAARRILTEAGFYVWTGGHPDIGQVMLITRHSVYRAAIEFHGNSVPIGEVTRVLQMEDPQ